MPDQPEPAPRCEHCGGPVEFIPYHDQAGCGYAIIELWRCQQCGRARYGDVIGQVTCDLDPQSSAELE